MAIKFQKSDNPKILRPDVSDVAIFVAGAVVQQSSNNELKGTFISIKKGQIFEIATFKHANKKQRCVYGALALDGRESTFCSLCIVDRDEECEDSGRREICNVRSS